jgi:hypothetical protein
MTVRGEGGFHDAFRAAHAGAQFVENQRIFDWLDEEIAPTTPSFGFGGAICGLAGAT